jgi:hypothetical protein
LVLLISIALLALSIYDLLKGRKIENSVKMFISNPCNFFKYSFKLVIVFSFYKVTSQASSSSFYFFLFFYFLDESVSIFITSTIPLYNSAISQQKPRF